MSSESCQPPKNRVESRSSISHQIPPPVWDRPAWPPRPPVRLPTQPTARRELTHTPSFTHPARSAINRLTASAFSASDNGSKAIIASAAENESALIGTESTRLETEPPIPSPSSFSGKLVQPVVQRGKRRVVTRCGISPLEPCSRGLSIRRLRVRVPPASLLERSLLLRDSERFLLVSKNLASGEFAGGWSD